MATSSASGKAIESFADREIVITRVFDAPPELVWKAWTDPERIVLWWGPRGFTTTIHKMDVHPGGIWDYTMHGPDGTDYPAQCVFLEVVKPERIVFSLTGGRGEERTTHESTWTFRPQGNKTLLTLHMRFPSAEAREHVVKSYGAIEGGNQTLERLARHLVEYSTK
jgi:uncharacterized protein YndB with AHSA1/START domain